MTAAERNRETHAEYVRLGICTKCHQRKSTADYQTCPECREWFRAYNQRRRLELPLKRRCIQCGGPQTGTQVRCERCAGPHIAASVERRQALAARGLCPQCGRPANGQYRCPECHERHRLSDRNSKQRLQAARASCAHETWRVIMSRPVVEGGEILMMWMERCRGCGFTRRRVVSCSPMRLVEVMSWRGEVPAKVWGVNE